MLGILVIRWTIRLAMLLFATAVVLRVLDGRRWQTSTSSRSYYAWAWTLGALLFTTHVIAAMHFHHHWSLSSAVETTAVETERLMGVRFGEGVYFSFVFLAIWIADVAWMLAQPRTYFARTAIANWIVTGYLLFIAFHGTVVFESGVSRIGGIIATLLLIGSSIYAFRRPALATSNSRDQETTGTITGSPNARSQSERTLASEQHQP